ncbi:bacterio-opsin activator [Sulfolobales archaeon HS-7]|nr:bacterio-opsin activator [Sulfolobales archaeon HS-7]
MIRVQLTVRRGFDWLPEGADVSLIDIRNGRDCVRCIIEVKGVREGSEEEKVSTNTIIKVVQTKEILFQIMSSLTVQYAIIGKTKSIWELLLTDYEEMRNVISELFKNKVDVRVDKIHKLRSTQQLTPKQERILRIAVEHGYYDFPRKIELSELAKKLEISPSTLSEILRRAEKNVILDYLRNKSP